jgi:citrate synthase
MLQMVVAEKLGYTLQELMERITVEELWLWSAFYEIRHEQEKKAMEDARRRRR